MEKHVCEFCGESYEKTPNNISKHLFKCEEYKEYKNSIIESLTYDFLYSEYVIEEKSVTQIAKESGFKKGNYIQKKLIEFNIPLRNSSESRFAKGYINLTKKKCNEKYGCDYHTLKESPIRENIYQGVKDKYGVENIFQAKEVKDKIKTTILEKYGVEFISQAQVVKDKFKETCLNKYGVNNVSQVQEFISKAMHTKANRVYTNSHTSLKSEKFFTELYDKIDYKHEHIYFKPKTKEYTVMSENNKLYCYDFVDTKLKKCIEFNGNYWHSNPLMYESFWVNPHTKLTSLEVQQKDQEKINTIKNLRGYDCLVIWEKDYDENPEEEINKCVEFLKN